MTTPQSEETHRAVRDALSGGAQLVVDCTEASEIDVSFLQLLVAAQRSAERSGKTIALSAPPEGALADALKRCGFAAAAGTTALARLFPPAAGGAA